jgi:hypothetical protein
VLHAPVWPRRPFDLAHCYSVSPLLITRHGKESKPKANQSVAKLGQFPKRPVSQKAYKAATPFLLICKFVLK